MWTDRRILELFGIEHPILLSPMANASSIELAVAVSEAGGLGAIPCAGLNPEQVRGQLQSAVQRSLHPLNVNFFCHRPPVYDAAKDARWRARLSRFYQELAVEPLSSAPPTPPPPFDEDACALIEEFKPKVVSFHFGLPEESLLKRVKAAGAVVLSSATTVEEARWLEQRGCDAIVAQGYEAGGHRGMFLDDDVATQVGGLSLIPQVVDAVRVPVIAAGGIADGRGIAAALVLGAAAAQIGTAYLLTPESGFKPIQRETLRRARDNSTALANVLTGRPARAVVNRLTRELGFIDPEAPAFPQAAWALAPLRKKAEGEGLSDFVYALFGQSAPMAQEVSAAELTRALAKDALARLRDIRA